MKVPLHWLHDYVVPDLDAQALAERLAMTGTEVERVTGHGVGGLDYFVVGRVLSAERHPDADRLRVCLVELGDGAPAQIVCGAPNVAAGQIVAVARPGAVMPDGTKLRKAKLRGQESNGMILAEDEIGIGTDHNGIMVLGADGEGPQPGTPLVEVLPLSTEVLELEITQNRPDCLSVYGVAREVHAATGARLQPPPWAQDDGSAGEVAQAAVAVDCPDLCPRFTARVFEDVTVGPSPAWLKARLMAAGQRPISNVVDITNYVMLLTGQPLHAFDLDRVAGHRLVVRRAQEGEQVQTLDDQTRTMDPEMVVICDDEGPTALAGVMGGARSEVQASTTRVLMEAATWDGATVHRTSLRLGLRSEASGRFEKGLQPELTLQAQAVVTQLMVELCGATVAPGTIDVGGEGPAPAVIRLRDARIESLLGAAVPRPRSRQILEALEFDAIDAPDGLDVTVPFFRRLDVTREADLIEEVARIDGVQKLPATLPARRGASGRLTARQRLRRAASDALIAQGVHEIVGWSFAAADAAARLRLPDTAAVELENPMSAEQSRLRTSLLGSLLDVARRNRSRGAGTVRVFEAGSVYLPRGLREAPAEPYHLGALLLGPVRPPTWRDPEPRPADFFAAKGALGAVLDTLRVNWTVQSTTEPFLHPGRAARILIGADDAGWVGELHPTLAAEWGLEETVAAFELDLDAVAEPATPLFVDVTSFPEIREDLAVVVADTVSADDVLAVVRRAGRPLLAGAEVFDVYRSAQRLGEGNVSLALALRFRAADRTLTDAEVAAQRETITVALAEQVGGRIRS